MAKKFKGNPERNDPWVVFLENVRYDDEWWVCSKKPQESNHFCTVKIAAEESAPRKANYWMSWNGSYLFGRDAGIMKNTRPDLYDAVIAALKA